MKKTKAILLSFIVLSLLCFANISRSQTEGVAINSSGDPPNYAAMLDVASLSKGILIPRMEQSQRDGINPVTGLLIYQTNNTPGFYFYNGSSWVLLRAGYISELSDADGNTKVQVEENPDEDIIRFDIAGTEKMKLIDSRLEFANTGQSVFIGGLAGANDNLSSNYNVFIGDSAGTTNTNGQCNTAIGFQSLYANIVGSYNTASGYNSLKSNLYGNYNTAAGFEALYSNTTGSYNTAYGYRSLRQNLTGSSNTAAGLHSLYNNLTGNSNVAIGTRALYECEDRNNIVAIGDSALFNNGTGATTSTQASYNTAIGSKALYGNTTGFYNTATGYQVMKTNTTGKTNTAYGSKALFSNTTGDENIAIGYMSLTANTIGNESIGIGYMALYQQTGYTISKDLCNIAIGNLALYHNNPTSASNARNNVAIGHMSLWDNTEGYANTAIGYESLKSNDTAYGNTAVGYRALVESTGQAVTAVGYHSLQDNTSGSANTAIGGGSLFDNTTGSENTAVGTTALHHNETGNQNTACGRLAGPAFSDLDNTGAFGFAAEPTASNYIHIGNTVVEWIGGQTTWSIYSDSRFKRNIKENVSGLDFIMKLRPVTFQWDIHLLNEYIKVPEEVFTTDNMIEAVRKKESRVYTGFLAQEVEEAARTTGFDFSGLHTPANEITPYSLSYSEFVVPLVKAVQEQQEIIEELKQRIEELEKRVVQ